MNNMGFFNPFGGSGSGGGGGGSTANYSVQAVTDSSGQVSYKLTKNGTAVGDVISFNGSNMLVSYGGELVVLNSAIAGIEEALDKTYNFTTFTELEIDTHNKTLTQITDELLTKNLPQNTIVTGQIYTDALPFSGNGEAEVLVNRPAFWWTCKSLTTAPYSWTALTADQACGGVIYDWTPSNYELPTASSSTLGGVKIGSGLSVDANGVLSADGSSYILPTASDSTLGGVKVGSGLAIDQNGVLSATGGGGGTADIIAGDGISIVTGGQIVTDLSSANWENYADMYDGQRSPQSDSRTFKLRYFHIEPGTQFKIKLTPADPNDTIYWYLYGYENDFVTTGGLHFGQSSDPNDWDTDCDYVYTMPTGKSSLDITVRINNTQYGYGDVVTLSKFDEMQYITGAGPTTKTINVIPATAQAIGGVIIGDGITVDENGVISTQISEITAQDVDDLWESLIPSASDFVSNTQAVSDGYDDGDIGVATQDT